MQITREDAEFIGIMARAFIRSMDVIDSVVKGVNTDDARLKALALLKRINEKDAHIEKPESMEKKA